MIHEVQITGKRNRIAEAKIQDKERGARKRCKKDTEKSSRKTHAERGSRMVDIQRIVFLNNQTKNLLPHWIFSNDGFFF